MPNDLKTKAIDKQWIGKKIVKYSTGKVLLP